MSPRNLKKSIELSLEFIDNLDNDEVYQSFMNIFEKFVYQLNYIKDEEENLNNNNLFGAANN